MRKKTNKLSICLISMVSFVSFMPSHAMESKLNPLLLKTLTCDHHIQALACTNEDTILAFSEKHITVFCPNKKRIIKKFDISDQLEFNYISFVTFSPQKNMLAVIGVENEVVIFNISQTKAETYKSNIQLQARHFLWLPDNQHFLTIVEENINVYHCNDETLTIEKAIIPQLNFLTQDKLLHPDESLEALSPSYRFILIKKSVDLEKKELLLFDTRDSEIIYKSITYPCGKTTFVRDNLLLISNGRTRLDIANILDNTVIREPLKNNINDLAISEDERCLAVASGIHVLLIEPVSGHTMHTLTPKNPCTVCKVTCSKDGTYIAASLIDKTLHIWKNPQYRKPLCKLSKNLNKKRIKKCLIDCIIKLEIN